MRATHSRSQGFFAFNLPEAALVVVVLASSNSQIVHARVLYIGINYWITKKSKVFVNSNSATDLCYQWLILRHMIFLAWVYDCYQSLPPLGLLEPAARSGAMEFSIRGYASRPRYENNASPLCRTLLNSLYLTEKILLWEGLKFWRFIGDMLCVDRSLDLVGHQVKKILTLVTDRVGRRYTSHHVIP